MFLERLRQISSRVEGVEALSLVAEDGIPIESLNAGTDLDLDLLAAELVSQARSITSDHRELAVGDVQQFSVTTDRHIFIVSAVAKGYYLLLVLREGATYGRARFELRRARLLFEDDLG